MCCFGYPPVISHGWRKTSNYDRTQNLRRNAKNEVRPRLGLPQLLRAVPQCATAPGNATAEVLPVHFARGNLRGLLPGADWVRSRTPLQPKSAGRLCFCRKAMYHQAREGLLKTSVIDKVALQCKETALISRFGSPAVTCLSRGFVVAQKRNVAVSAYSRIINVTL